MNAEILAVGTELLMGQIANTNAQYISGRLANIGVNVYFHSVVGDNPKRLEDSLKLALERSDIVIMTGGLGPTQDDLTKETVSSVLGKKLVLHQESLDRLEAFFSKIQRTMTPNNIKQAYLPEGCIVMTNHKGTAPGCIIESGEKMVAMLPGPPSEMKPMFEEFIISYLTEKSDYRLESKYLRIFGIGESLMEDKIKDLIEAQSNPTIAPYAKEGEVTLRVTARYGKNEHNTDLLTPVIDEITKRLGDAIYSYEDKEMETVVGELLIGHGMTISSAESCTGGLVSSKLISVPGISQVFNRAIVAYSNDAKIENLGVKPETLEKYGAVSAETAKEMAEGIRNLSKTRLGIATTGVAGPGGGTEAKPVGLVYVALSDGKSTDVRELRLWGDRSRIRNGATLNALDLIRRWIIARS
ncbi:MAG TPA: competence/damage-inducible protein A [Clostridia bacterium]